MRRYWVDRNCVAENEVIFEGDTLHHIRDVCRRSLGDKFEILYGDSQALFVEVTEMSKRQGRAKILERRTIEPLPKPQIHLCVSVPRFQTFENIIEKSVEMGIFAVHPFVSDFSFVRKLGGPLAKKQDRWMKIIKGATQQTGRGELMPLYSAEKLEDLLESFNRQTKAAGLFPYEGECPQDIQSHLQQLKSQNIDSVWVFVGSEGGFSEQEVKLFGENGLMPITLGPQVLRVETACLVTTSVIKYEFGGFKSWVNQGLKD